MIAPAYFSTRTLSTRTTSARAARVAASRQEALHDAELVRRFNAGDESAFVEIAQNYRTRMFAVALSMLKNHADAEEIAQDALVRAYRALPKFRGDSSLSTWLHHIALNLARNRYWHLLRRRQNVTCSLDQTLSADGTTTFSDLVATDAAGPAREAATTEFMEVVTTCMARMSPGARTILAMRNAQDLSYQEIAARLGLKIGTVKSRIARAREMLRALMIAACPEFGIEAQPAAWFESIRPSAGFEVLAA
jgi:RNA polymerase sigma-70 factor (ECF subfamily)